MSLACVKLQHTAVEKRINEEIKGKNAYTCFLRSITGTMTILIKKEASQWCLIQENRQNGVVILGYPKITILRVDKGTFWSLDSESVAIRHRTCPDLVHFS